MCTWLVIESAHHFLRNGSNVYSCFMDMRKAFDMVKHSILFKKLMDRKLSPIFMRLMLIMYISQKANVRWGTSYSTSFSITNGVKQGAVLSAVLFCMYMDMFFYYVHNVDILTFLTIDLVSDGTDFSLH